MGAAQTRSFLVKAMNARALAVLLLLLGLFGGAVSAAAPQVVGIAAAVLNDVRIKGVAARQFSKAAPRQRVALADQVQTGGSSRLQLLLLDKSKFTVGANARLTIDRFVYDPNGSSMSASVAKGAFRFMSGRAGGAKNSSIKSPAATIGIRGTLLDGVVGDAAVAIARGEREIRGNIRHDPATATLVVLRGPGPRTLGNLTVGAVDVEAGGKVVTLDRPLLAAYVPYAGAQPIGPFTISLTGVARLNDLLLEPQEVLYDPNAAPVYQPSPDRDRPYYDYPPPGGFDDGPGPRGGGNMPGIPGLNGLPNMPDRPDRPNRTPPRRTPQPPSSTPPGAGPTSTPSSTTGQSGTQLYLPDNPPPQTGPSSTPNNAPTTGPTGGPTGTPSGRTGSTSPNYP